MSTAVYNDTWTASELAGRKTWWLLDITYAGTVYRLAEEALDVTSTELGEIHYLPCILNDITVGYGFSLFSDSAEQQSVGVECFLGSSDVAAMVAAGHDLAGSPCVLSKWIEGQDYDVRRVFVVGRMKNPVYGGVGEPIRFSLQDAFFDDYALIPATESRTSKVTVNLDTVAVDDLGLVYPLVFGNPGKCATLQAGWCAGSQGVWRNKIDNAQELIVAGHTTNMTAVMLSNDALISGASYVVRQSIDDFGAPISVVASGEAQAASSTGYAGLNGTGAPTELLAVYDPLDDANNVITPVYVSWWIDDANDQTGGLLRAGKVIRGAGDVIQYVLGFSKYRFDSRRIAGIAEQLNTFAIDAVIDAQVRPWDWVRTNLIPILPVSVTNGTNGVYFVPWLQTSGNPVCSLNDGVDVSVEFARTIETDTQQINNDLTLEYALDVRTDTYQQTLQMLPLTPPVFASGSLITLRTSSILITSAASGPAGGGMVVKVTGNHPGSLITEDAAARTVHVELDFDPMPPNLNPPVDTVQKTVDFINANSSLIKASLRPGSDGSEAVNAFYNINGSDGYLASSFKQTITLVAESSTTLVYSPYAALSQNRYQYVSGDGSGTLADTMSSICVYDPATAGAILSWKMRAFAFAHKFVQGIAPENRYGWLQLGQEVAVTSSRLSLSNQSMIVQRLEYGNDGMIAFRLAWIEDPFRDG
jgi:hypothetical protein